MAPPDTIPDLVSSEPIGGTDGTSINTIKTSLAALKEGSALASRIPYISPIAGLLLQALAIRDVSVRLFPWPSNLSTSTWLGSETVR